VFAIAMATTGIAYANLAERLNKVETSGSPPFRERMASSEGRLSAVEERQRDYMERQNAMDARQQVIADDTRRILDILKARR